MDIQRMERIEQQLKEYVQQMVATDPAHDVSHIERVVLAAKQFAHQEGAKIEVIIPAAWLHDCVSLAKEHPQRHITSRLAAEEAIRFLRSVDYPEQYYAEIKHAIEAHSYSANIPVKTLEAAIVQDADRIDALGAIGIARCIQVGTSFKASLYSDEDPFCETRVYNDRRFTVDHFYTKLFKLQDTMNTPAARQEAVKRTEYMKSFLTQLRHEIQG